jgi:hypothetical protein
VYEDLVRSFSKELACIMPRRHLWMPHLEDWVKSAGGKMRKPVSHGMLQAPKLSTRSKPRPVAKFSHAIPLSVDANVHDRLNALTEQLRDRIAKRRDISTGGA